MLFPQTTGTESDDLTERRFHTYFTILSILQIIAFSRNSFIFLFFIYVNYGSNSHIARGVGKGKQLFSQIVFSMLPQAPL